jgi:hypothetical protein
MSIKVGKPNEQSATDGVGTSRRATEMSVPEAKCRCQSDDPMFYVAAHEAGHAVARIRCHEALGRHWQSFDRVLIRRDFSRPYADDRREIEC